MDLDNVRRELRLCIDNKTVEWAKTLVRCLTRQQRMTVTRQKTDDGLTLLFRAVINNRPSFVNFLLDECHADVDQRCDVGEWRKMTPLCCAAQFLGARMARVLVEHGADVNAAPDDHCTAVNTACHRNPQLVEYLVEHGADINIPDIYGNTCLMSALAKNPHRSQLSQYLVDRGASVNVVDNLGENALFYSLDGQRNVRMLLSHGVNTAIRNQSGDDILQTAAIEGRTEMLDYLIARLTPTQQRRADLYALAAAQKVDELNDFTGGVQLWKQALSCRTQGALVHVNDRNPVYDGAVEAADVSALEAIADDEDALYMQALIRRERILGSSHRETIHWLFSRALHYASSRNLPTHRRGIELYNYASASCDVASLHVLRGMDVHVDFVFMFIGIYEENPASVRFDDLAEVIRVMVKMGRYSVTCSRAAPSAKLQINRASVIALQVLWCLQSSEEEALTRKQLAWELVRSTRQTCLIAPQCQSLLHLLSFEPWYITDPMLETVKVLLEVGADVNEVDSAGNTMLLKAVRNAPNTPPERDNWLRVIDLLLRHGAHVDISNVRGETAVDLLPPSVDKMQHITLQCLSARAVRRHNITYRGIVPTTLADFTDQH